MSEQSDTPRTDAEEYSCASHLSKPTSDYVDSSFARQLERELAAMRSERDALKAELSSSISEWDEQEGVWKNENEDLRNKLASLGAVVERWRNVLEFCQNRSDRSKQAHDVDDDTYFKWINERTTAALSSDTSKGEEDDR